MALVIDLKPNEKLLIGSTIVVNDDQRTRLRIEGDAPILREKDTMTAEEAVTPSKKLYLTIQEMYLANANQAMDHLDDYFSHLKAITELAPHISDFLNDVSIYVLEGVYYKALKLVKDLIAFENDGTEPQTYKKSSDETEGQFNQMHMEAQLLDQSTAQLQDLYDRWDDVAADERASMITYNRKLWMVFFDDVNGQASSTGEKKSSDGFDMTTNIVNLYNFIYKRSAVLIETSDKEKLTTLIALNQTAAKALKR